jgi:hypothetical protein
MRIDRAQKPWLLGTVLVAATAIAVYVALAAQAPERPAGASPVGLWYGLAGTALLGVAGLLWLVRRLPVTWPIGPRSAWLRAHLWIGSLAAVFLLCHSGFRWGGPLERLLWLSAGGVVLTGVAGLLLQHLLPPLLTTRVPDATAPGYHEQARRTLVRQGDALVDGACGVFDPRSRAEAAAWSGGDSRQQVRAFYEEDVRPFLSGKTGRRAALADPRQATELFGRLQRASALATYRPVLDQLAALCDERRLLSRQQRLSFWMHSWLLLHVPLSAALVVFTTAHAITALYY